MTSLTTREVIIPAEITPRGVGIYLTRLNKTDMLRLSMYAGCCSQDFLGQASTIEVDTQDYTCGCGMKKIDVKRPHRLTTKDPHSPRVTEWIEHWTGLEDITVEVKG